jgi:hypothetical protein
MIEKLANWMYNVEPEITEVDKMIDAANTVEELESMKELIRHTDSIRLYNLWNDKMIKLK